MTFHQMKDREDPPTPCLSRLHLTLSIIYRYTLLTALLHITQLSFWRAGCKKSPLTTMLKVVMKWLGWTESTPHSQYVRMRRITNIMPVSLTVCEWRCGNRDIVCHGRQPRQKYHGKYLHRPFTSDRRWRGEVKQGGSGHLKIAAISQRGSGVGEARR